MMVARRPPPSQTHVIHVAPHPLLEIAAFETVFPVTLGELPPAPALVRGLDLAAPAPLASDDDVRAAVRRLLRHGGYRPTGRGKPASEYLLGAAQKGDLGSINPAVDACNVASLHSGLPISVVDLDLVAAPLAVAVAGEGASYVFNRSGQTIDLAGLLCLCDAAGPCANAVKDAQRSKTHEGTRRTLSVVWGTNELTGRASTVASWYRVLLAELGARTAPVVGC